MTDIVRYAEVTEEAFDAEANRANQIAGSVILEIKQGENVVRFVPPKDPKHPFLRSTAMHYVELPGLERIAVFACPKVELKQPCPACEAAARLTASPSPVDKQLGDRIGQKMTVYANVVDRSAPADDPNYGLRVIRFGKQILEQLKTIRRSQRTGGDFFNPGPQGFDIVIMREGEQRSTKYKVIPDRNNCPIFDDAALVQAVIDNQYDLNQYVDPATTEEVLRALDSCGRGSATARGSLPPPARAAYTPAVRAEPAGAPAGQARAGAGLFDGPPRATPSAAQTVAEAEFTDEDDDDFGPPPQPQS